MLSYQWRAGGATHELRLVQVPGTSGVPYVFGAESRRRPIAIRDFHIMATPVTQALWQHIMGSNPARRPDLRCPVENVSWYDVTGPDGFLDRINASAALAAVSGAVPQARFRLPSEAEWEYAARGGCHHNWDLHCTVHWRYGIEPGAHDGCIGLRLALS